MFCKLISISLLSIGLVSATLVQSSTSPSGDPSGNSKGTASDANPVGEPVGKEPAMIDPRSPGSKHLDARATIDCAASAKAKGKTATKIDRPNDPQAKAACK
jgi:hypothetical protein